MAMKQERIDLIIDKLRSGGYIGEISRNESWFGWKDIFDLAVAIGKSKSENFRIDEQNEFVYKNLAKWVAGDESMERLDPLRPDVVIPGNLEAGIYLAGNTGTGKSWALDIFASASMSLGNTIEVNGENRQLSWINHPVDDICNHYIRKQEVDEYKSLTILGIQDLGREPDECMSMGNRQNPIRGIIEYRGDRQDMITIISSNMKLGGEKLKAKYGERCQSRLLAMCNYFELKGDDRRLASTKHILQF